MTKILFVCHGNICRSPMAEFIMKKRIVELGVENIFISSAATSTEEIGNDMHPPAKYKLSQKGIPFSPREARQIKKQDYGTYDYIIGMDEYNVRNMKAFFNGDPENKISMLLDRPVADPWYTGDFELTYQDISEGIEKLLKTIMETEKK